MCGDSNNDDTPDTCRCTTGYTYYPGTNKCVQNRGNGPVAGYDGNCTKSIECGNAFVCKDTDGNGINDRCRCPIGYRFFRKLGKCKKGKFSIYRGIYVNCMMNMCECKSNRC